MPLYDFICKSCGFEFEQFRKMDEENPGCLKCKTKTEKKIMPVYGRVTGSEHRPLDCIVGADSEKRWQGIEKRNNRRKNESKKNSK